MLAKTKMIVTCSVLVVAVVIVATAMTLADLFHECPFVGRAADWIEAEVSRFGRWLVNRLEIDIRP